MALKILDLPFDEVIIDLAKPRDDWYLKEINSVRQATCNIC